MSAYALYIQFVSLTRLVGFKNILLANVKINRIRRYGDIPSSATSYSVLGLLSLGDLTSWVCLMRFKPYNSLDKKKWSVGSWKP